MVVGRRRVAAASVATAYALHVYVLQHHFRPPQTDRPSLPLPTHPHCRKVGAQRSRSGYFSWVLVPPLPSSPYPSASRSLTLDPSDRLAPLAWTLSIHRDPFNPPPSRTYSSRIRTLFLPLANDAPGSAGSRRTAPRASFPLGFIPVYPSIAHILFLLL